MRDIYDVRLDARQPAADALDTLAVETIRCLTMDAVQKANSGHPGLPMAMAPVGYVLYKHFLRHDPSDPVWLDRDRFVLSAGHGSMLLYSLLHLSGYDLTLEEIKDFRQWGSRTPGHPEHRTTPGVEATTGPLGQGFANGVGMAIAERFLRMRYGSDVMSHRVFAICSDGDVMEGIASEAASLAGNLGLGRLIYIYDDNSITIDGATSLSFAREDVDARFRAYGWHVQSVHSANDLAAVGAAIEAAIAEDKRPSLIRVRSVIGYPAPQKQGRPVAHGAPLGEDEVRATKRVLGWNPDQHFVVPAQVPGLFAANAERGAREHHLWRERFDRWATRNPALAAEWERAWAGQPQPGLAEVLPKFDVEQKPIATRTASGKAMAAFADHVPTMVGGSADLADSTKAKLPGRGSFEHSSSGANVHWGVREHAMAAAVNGLALHGGIIRPFGATFLVFSDYMRPSIRLSALMELPVVWVFSHDSVAVGEDGPTHQPIEHYAALRAIPGLTVIRPADANETVQAWQVALEHARGPICMLLTRQDLPVLAAVAGGLARGAYIRRDAGDGEHLDVVLLASGSEVSVALEAQSLLESEAIRARVVSMPSWELFDAQDDEYRGGVLPSGVPVVSVEAGIAMGWARYAHVHVSIDHFGASAPGGVLLERYGITPEHVAEAARGAIASVAVR
ncbi:MAG: transketolase [Solirubrobacteraceae bacterium]